MVYQYTTMPCSLDDEGNTMTEQPGAVAPPANNFLAYLRAFDPGIVVALSWVGTGDWKENVGLGLVAAFVAVAAVQGIGKAVGELFS